MPAWVSALIRHGLTAAGAALVAKGVVDEGTWTEIAGGVVALIGVIWSLMDKKGR